MLDIDFSWRTAKSDFYRGLAAEAASLVAGENDPIANAVNVAALLYLRMPGLNWSGFYFRRENDELVLGPFQGKPACVRIPKGRGVCGAALARRQPVLVHDVHAFPDHIACDEASRSELVVPLLRDDEVLGVIDLDSPKVGRFDLDDQKGLERIAEIYVGASWT